MLTNWKFAAPNPLLEKEAQHFLQLWESQATYEIQSSGTTGTPQIFRFSHKQMLHSAKASIAALELNTQTKALLCLPTSSVGAKMLMARSLVGAFKLILQQPSSRPLQHLDQTINFIAMVPTQLQQSLLHDLDKLKCISKILVGGGELTPALKNACRAAGLHVWQSYGMTETLSHVALQQISPAEAPYYSALTGIQFSTKNDCLVIHYPQMQLQAFYTKDLVTLHSATSFTWLGRAYNAINSGGFKIIPELIEQKLAGHFQNPFFTIGIPDEKWGQVVGIVFEGEVVKDYLHFDGLGLSSAEIPKKYACIQVFKRTSTHKIQRKEILQSLSNADWKSI